MAYTAAGFFDHSRSGGANQHGGGVYVSEEAQITVSVPASERVVKLSREHVSFVSIGKQLWVDDLPDDTLDRLEGLVSALEAIGEILAPYGRVSGKSLEIFRELVAHIVVVCEAFPAHVLRQGTHQMDDLRLLISRDSMSTMAFKAAVINLSARLRQSLNTLRPMPPERRS